MNRSVSRVPLSVRKNVAFVVHQNITNFFENELILSILFFSLENSETSIKIIRTII